MFNISIHGIAMGHYGFYVWGAYGIALIILILNARYSKYRSRRILSMLRKTRA